LSWREFPCATLSLAVLLALRGQRSSVVNEENPKRSPRFPRRNLWESLTQHSVSAGNVGAKPGGRAFRTEQSFEALTESPLIHAATFVLAMWRAS